jgi:hypothetical protein
MFLNIRYLFPKFAVFHYLYFCLNQSLALNKTMQ